MSHRSKKAQFSRSLKNKSIHIGGKSEKVTPPPLKKPTSALDNRTATANEMRSLKERIAQRKELNVLFFHLKQMADFLEADINQFKTDLYLPNKKLSISNSIISPQEHLICERCARKIFGSVFYDGFYDLNYIKTNHDIINSSRGSLVELYETKSAAKRILLDDQYGSYNSIVDNIRGNVIYNNWAATLLPILQIQHYMAIKELVLLKQYEPCFVSNFFTAFTADDASILMDCGQIVLNSFSTACEFSSALEDVLVQKDFICSMSNFAQKLNILATMNKTSDSDNIEIPEPQDLLTGVNTELQDQQKLMDLAVGLAPSPDTYISFDDCFDNNCSIIDVDKELSQLDLSNDPSLAASLRKVYCDFNKLLQQQNIAQQHLTNIEFTTDAMSHGRKLLFVLHKKSFFLAQTELLASATKPIEQFAPDLRHDNAELSQQEDVHDAMDVLNSIINEINEDTIPHDNLLSATIHNVQEYQLSCIALFGKERSFFANIGVLISAIIDKRFGDYIDLLQQKTEFKEFDVCFFHQYITSLFLQEKTTHCFNLKTLTVILAKLEDFGELDELDDKTYQDLNLISNINQAANTANLFKVVTRFLHCFIDDDYEFARLIVDAYNKQYQQSELDKLLNEAQVVLTSHIEQLKGKNQAHTVQAENVAADANSAQSKVWPAGSIAANEPSKLTPKSGEPQTPEQHISDTQTVTKGDTESQTAKAKPSKAKAVKAKAKTKATTAKASAKDTLAATQQSTVSAADATALTPSEQGITLLNAEERKSLMAALAEQNPNPKSELNYSNQFELLCAVVLSAQATDASVNLVTPELFAAAPTPEKMAALGEEAIGNLIKRVGLWRNKAKNLAQLAAILHEEYNDQVPDSFNELIKLPGVGAKTARVVLNVAFGQPYIAVDTHVFRVCNRTGLCLGNTAEKVAKHLPDLIDPEFLMNAHHYLLLHGRYVCTSKNFEERCATCVAAPWCKHNYPKD